ncbi:transcription termination factor MTEF18, mitochondrial-like [Carex rostrata]
MSTNLFLGRIHCLHPSLSLNRTTPLASSNAPTQASPPNPHFTVQYLVQSCGLSSDEALQASKHIQHLKSSNLWDRKTDAVLCFLREIGVSESDIKSAVSLEPRILCSNVEKKWRPNIAKLLELGFSIEDISDIIADNPYIFQKNFVPKIDFLLGILGSVENLSVILKATKNSFFIRSSLDKVFIPNLSFLQEHCGFSPSQLMQIMISAPAMMSFRHDVFKMEVERAEELGVARSSGTFINALLTVCYQKQCTIDAKLDNLTSIGFSQEEVALMIRKTPMLLRVPEKLVISKMEYLIKEADFDKIDVVKYPALLAYSLENRLIPRTIVKKLLMVKELPVAYKKFGNFIQLSEEKFLNKFILPYEHAIPGLSRAYADASTGKSGGVESFKEYLKLNTSVQA